MRRCQAGDRVNNYLLDEPIGAGTFGEVWRARHHVFNHPVAVKVPTDPQYVRYLQREGVAVHGLRHPNVVRALDMDPYAEPPYLIMEYVAGRSLRHEIDTHPDGLAIESAVAVLYGTISALQAAHEAGIIHRDIKPANILIADALDSPGGRRPRAEGPDAPRPPACPGDALTITPQRVKVTDFGLGCRADGTNESIRQSGSMHADASRRFAGTLVYMSPEQRDGQSLDARSDLYSVGVVLHEMLTGMLPQGSDLPSAIRSDSPGWLDQLFERCYTRREHRLASASAVRELVEQRWPRARQWPGGHDAAPPRVVQAGERLQCACCHATVGPDDQFCTNCGHQLVDHVPRCPSCYGFIGRTDSYCTQCGTDLRRSA